MKKRILISDSAEVTASGILFRGCLYSSHRALREQWFELVHVCDKKVWNQYKMFGTTNELIY
jgi:hypothetical protein